MWGYKNFHDQLRGFESIQEAAAHVVTGDNRLAHEAVVEGQMHACEVVKHYRSGNLGIEKGLWMMTKLRDGEKRLRAPVRRTACLARTKVGSWLKNRHLDGKTP